MWTARPARSAPSTPSAGGNHRCPARPRIPRGRTLRGPAPRGAIPVVLTLPERPPGEHQAGRRPQTTEWCGQLVPVNPGATLISCGRGRRAREEIQRKVLVLQLLGFSSFCFFRDDFDLLAEESCHPSPAPTSLNWNLPRPACPALQAMMNLHFLRKAESAQSVPVSATWPRAGSRVAALCRG